VASRKDWTSFQPDRRRVDSHFVLLNPPPAIKSARKRRRRKPRHLARSRSGHQVLTAPQPAATSSRISAPKKSKPRPTSPGHLGTLTHECRFADRYTHFSRQNSAEKGRSTLFGSLTHTSVFDQPVRRRNYQPADSCSGSVPTVAQSAPNVVAAQVDVIAIGAAGRITPQVAQACHRSCDALDHAHN